MDRLLHYDITEQLGEGKNGPTYLALDSGLQRAVVIKIIEQPEVPDQSWWEAFEQQMARFAEVGDDRMAQVYGHDEGEGHRFVLREYIEGRPLSQLVAGGRMTYYRFLEIALDVAHVIGKLSGLGLVHGNISAENIIVDPKGRLRFTDFSLGRFAGRWSGDTLPPADQVYLDSKHPASEEPTSQSDLFALGVLFCYLLTGRFPSAPDSSQKPEPRRDPGGLSFPDDPNRPIPGVARLLIGKLLAPEPGARFASAEELIRTLEGMISLGEEPLPAKPEKHSFSARQYLMVSILVLLVIIFWLVITSLDR